MYLHFPCGIIRGESHLLPPPPLLPSSHHPCPTRNLHLCVCVCVCVCVCDRDREQGRGVTSLIIPDDNTVAAATVIIRGVVRTRSELHRDG